MWFFFPLYRHSPCAILTAGILILMMAFAIFDSRHVTLFLEERTSAPDVQDGKGVARYLIVAVEGRSLFSSDSWITLAGTR